MIGQRRLAPLVALGFLLTEACGAPATPCMVANAHGGPGMADAPLGVPYVAVYYPRTGTEQGTCPDNGTSFASRPHRLYSETFGRSGSEPRPVGWTPEEFAYDPDTGEPPDRTHDPRINGRFTDPVVDSAGMCRVEAASVGQQEIAGELVTYDFRTVQVVGLAAVQGTEILAEVVLTRGSCVRTYDVLALWPYLNCSSAVDCDPLPDPDHGRPNGSGVLPSLPVECNAVLQDGSGQGICFFPGASPSGFPFLAGY